MKHRTFCIPALVLLGVIVSLAAPRHRSPSQPGDVARLQVPIGEFAVPTKGAHPHDPAVGPDGALWFTEQMANKIGRLGPSTGKFTEFPLPRNQTPALMASSNLETPSIPPPEQQ